MSYSIKSGNETGRDMSWNMSAVGSIQTTMFSDDGNKVHGQNLQRLFSYTEGHLLEAAKSITQTGEPVIRILTGFYIEKAEAAETDGILAAAQMARFFELAGIECCVTTDKYCAPICIAALEKAGCSPEMLEVISDDSPESMKHHVNAWKVAKVTHAIAIERPGPSVPDERPYNMKGEVITKCAPLHELYGDGRHPWFRIGCGDRGNELGCGKLPLEVITSDIDKGGLIACRTGADWLLVSRVSNWAGYALISAVAVLGEQSWPMHLYNVLKSENQKNILVHMIKAGAVDGITHKGDPANPTVDGLPLDRHLYITKAFTEAVKSAVKGRSSALTKPANNNPAKPVSRSKKPKPSNAQPLVVGG